MPRKGYIPKRHYQTLSDEEKDYIRENGEKQSCNEIAEYIGCSPGTVVYYRRKYGLGHPSVIWEDKYEEFMELWNSGTKTGQLSRIYNVSPSAIGALVSRMRKQGFNLQRRSKRHIKNEESN